ncbi:hypothetical protein D1872_319630 [compost metagenome]
MIVAELTLFEMQINVLCRDTAKFHESGFGISPESIGFEVLCLVFKRMLKLQIAFTGIVDQTAVGVG